MRRAGVPTNTFQQEMVKTKCSTVAGFEPGTKEKNKTELRFQLHMDNTVALNGDGIHHADPSSSPLMENLLLL